MLHSSLCERLTAVGAAMMPLLWDAALKGIAILLLTGLATLAMRRASAAARHLVWFLGTLSLLVLPILSIALPAWYILPDWTTNATAPPIHVSAPIVASTPAFVPAPPYVQRPSRDMPLPVVTAVPAPPIPAATIVPSAASSPPVFAWQTWLFLAWLTGSCLYLGYVMFGFLSLWWLQRRSPRIAEGTADQWSALLAEVCELMHFHRPVELISSPDRTMPMTWGLWRTRILVPEDSIHWTAEQRRAVLLHELAHAKRLDCLTQLVTQLACALHWFNPLVWVAWRRMQTEREQACDDLVQSTGAKASAYAEQLLQIATEMPAVRFSAAAIAMARPSKLEGRLLAILDTTRNRRRLAARTVVLVTVVVGVCALLLAIVRADEMSSNPALRVARQWAARYGWKAQVVTPTDPDSAWGHAWHNPPFTLDKDEEADAKACVRLAEKAYSSINGKTEFSYPATRTALEEILKKRPCYFYAEFLLAYWHRDFGDPQQAAHFLDAAYRHAPVIVVQRYEFSDGSPLANFPIRDFAIEFNHLRKDSPDPNFKLQYPDLRTDGDGCLYLPVYNTACRRDNMAGPDGYFATFATFGWFESSRKVALLPVATVTPRPGDFVPPASATKTPVAAATLPNGGTIELVNISPSPDPQHNSWRPDGSPSDHHYHTDEPLMDPGAKENYHRLIFRLGKPLDPEDSVRFRFSVPALTLLHYGTLRDQDIDHPYILFASFPTHPKTISIRLGQTFGPWKVVAQYDPHTDKTSGALPTGFSFRNAIQDKTNTTEFSEVTVVHPLTESQLQVVAVDTDNHEYLPEHRRSEEMSDKTGVTFKDRPGYNGLSLDRIKSFRLESREYQWVEFRNIALEPAAAMVPSQQPAPSGLSAKVIDLSTAEEHAQGKFHWRVEPNHPMALVFRCDLLETPEERIFAGAGSGLSLEKGRAVEVLGDRTVKGGTTVFHYRAFYPKPNNVPALSDMTDTEAFGGRGGDAFTRMGVAENVTQLTQEYVPFAWGEMMKQGHAVGTVFCTVRVVAPEGLGYAINDPPPVEKLRVPATQPAAMGRVVDTQGRPIAQAELRSAISPWSATTDADGWYPFPGVVLTKPERVWIRAKGFVDREDVDLWRNGNGEIGPDNGVIQMHRPARLEGRVLGPDGKPLAGAPLSLTVREEYPHDGRMTANAMRAITDGQGRFTIDAPPGELLLYYPWEGPSNGEVMTGKWKAWTKPGEQYPSVPTRGVGTAMPLEVTEGQVVRDLVLDLSKSVGSVEGRVLDKQGKPLPGAQVFLSWTTPTSSSGACMADGLVKTDAQGRYKLQKLPTGPWHVQASFGAATASPVPVTLSETLAHAADLVVAVEQTATGRVRRVPPMNSDEAVREWIDATLAGDGDGVRAMVVPGSPFARHSGRISALLPQIKKFPTWSSNSEGKGEATTNEIDLGNRHHGHLVFKLIMSPNKPGMSGQWRISGVVDDEGHSLVADPEPAGR